MGKTDKLNYDDLTGQDKAMLDKAMDVTNDIKKLCKDYRTPQSGVTALLVLLPYRSTSDKEAVVMGAGASFIKSGMEMDLVMHGLKEWVLHDKVTTVHFMKMAAEITREIDPEELASDIYKEIIMKK